MSADGSEHASVAAFVHEDGAAAPAQTVREFSFRETLVQRHRDIVGCDSGKPGGDPLRCVAAQDGDMLPPAAACRKVRGKRGGHGAQVPIAETLLVRSRIIPPKSGLIPEAADGIDQQRRQCFIGCSFVERGQMLHDVLQYVFEYRII